ncbi:MAG: RNA methyltransferase [Candidatus Gastranaerophilales bacterium]|nr:RNA methyltransferase [Candidatus Gastranaerophilales bacterium]
MAKTITSTSNPTIVELAKLSNPKIRYSTGLFTVEGEKALEDILNSDTEIKDIFVIEDYDKIDNLPQENLTIASEAVMKKLATSDSVPKIITVAHQKIWDMFDLKEYDRLLLLDGISDPGNMGTLIRSAVAFGFEGILLNGNCVDPYNPKVIRSAAGNFFKIPFAKVANPFILKEFRNYTFIETDLHAIDANQPEHQHLDEKIILVLGSEANGISQDILNIPHENIRIATENVESLNVATAGSIIMYEFSKRF